MKLFAGRLQGDKVVKWVLSDLKSLLLMPKGIMRHIWSLLPFRLNFKCPGRKGSPFRWLGNLEFYFWFTLEWQWCRMGQVCSPPGEDKCWLQRGFICWYLRSFPWCNRPRQVQGSAFCQGEKLKGGRVWSHLWHHGPTKLLEMFSSLTGTAQQE